MAGTGNEKADNWEGDDNLEESVLKSLQISSLAEECCFDKNLKLTYDAFLRPWSSSMWNFIAQEPAEKSMCFPSFVSIGEYLTNHLSKKVIILAATLGETPTASEGGTLLVGGGGGNPLSLHTTKTA